MGSEERQAGDVEVEKWKSGKVEEVIETVAAIIDALDRAPGVILPLVREIPPDTVKRRPAAGKWSAHEHACHLAVVHRLFFDRLDELLARPHPVFRPYDPAADDPDDRLLMMDLEASLRMFADDRRRLVARLRQLTPEDWQRTAEHGEYSHYGMRIMFRHVALHDFFHAYRIEQCLLNKWAVGSGQ